MVYGIRFSSGSTEYIRLRCVTRGRINCRPEAVAGDRYRGSWSGGYIGRRPYRVYTYIDRRARPFYRRHGGTGLPRCASGPARFYWTPRGPRTTTRPPPPPPPHTAYFIYIHERVHAGRSVAAFRCQGIRRVIHTWNINHSPTHPSLMWYATTPRARTLSFFACSRSPHHVQRSCENYIHLYHAYVIYIY